MLGQLDGCLSIGRFKHELWDAGRVSRIREACEGLLLRSMDLPPNVKHTMA